MYMCVCVCVCVWEGGGEGGEGSGGGWVCVGAYVCVVRADSLRSVPQQLHEVKRMIGGLGNVLFSTCSQTLNGKEPRVSFGEPL